MMFFKPKSGQIENASCHHSVQNALLWQIARYLNH